MPFYTCLRTLLLIFNYLALLHFFQSLFSNPHSCYIDVSVLTYLRQLVDKDIILYTNLLHVFGLHVFGLMYLTPKPATCIWTLCTWTPKPATCIWTPCIWTPKPATCIWTQHQAGKDQSLMSSQHNNKYSNKLSRV